MEDEYSRAACEDGQIHRHSGVAILLGQPNFTGNFYPSPLRVIYSSIRESIIKENPSSVPCKSLNRGIFVQLANGLVPTAPVLGGDEVTFTTQSELHCE